MSNSSSSETDSEHSEGASSPSSLRGGARLLDGDARNEGTNPHWALKPPRGSVLVEHGQIDPGEFEWDEVEDSGDVDIILFRVPKSVSCYVEHTFRKCKNRYQLLHS
jgi:hypothetical protein